MSSSDEWYARMMAAEASRDRLASLLADAEAAKSDTALCAEIDHLRHLLAEARAYLRHYAQCSRRPAERACSCGLSDLLAEIQGGEE